MFCGGCKSRLIITKAKSSTGAIYPYFICLGKHNKTSGCAMQAIVGVRVLPQDSGPRTAYHSAPARAART
ncbi:MAG: hypothetical protein LBJ08_01915 [Bifidobacteriaceae bacterium]|nr:hypothetical protein [Bifidobacteriaceae bacterium]